MNLLSKTEANDFEKNSDEARQARQAEANNFEKNSKKARQARQAEATEAEAATKARQATFIKKFKRVPKTPIETAEESGERQKIEYVKQIIKKIYRGDYLNNTYLSTESDIDEFANSLVNNEMFYLSDSPEVLKNKINSYLTIYPPSGGSKKSKKYRKKSRKYKKSKKHPKKSRRKRR